jgi:hypothetical protein
MNDCILKITPSCRSSCRRDCICVRANGSSASSVFRPSFSPDAFASRRCPDVASGHLRPAPTQSPNHSAPRSSGPPTFAWRARRPDGNVGMSTSARAILKCIPRGIDGRTATSFSPTRNHTCISRMWASQRPLGAGGTSACPSPPFCGTGCPSSSPLRMCSCGLAIDYPFIEIAVPPNPCFFYHLGQKFPTTHEW